MHEVYLTRRTQKEIEKLSHEAQAWSWMPSTI